MNSLIEFDITFSDLNKSINIHIIETKTELKVALKILDEITDTKAYFEKTHEILEKIFDNTYEKEAVIDTLNELDKRHKKYKIVNHSLNKKQYQEYYSLFKAIKKYDYENSNQQEVHTTLDGYSVHLKKTTGDNIQTFEIQSQMLYSFPLLRKLLNMTLEHYKI